MSQAISTDPSTPLFFEDLQVGMRFTSSSVFVSAEDIIKFASVYDPQPFHTDPEKAKSTFFNGLAASGWHTAALTMQLLTNGTMPVSWGIVGAGADELRWPNAMRPGDTIHLDCEVVELRLLKSKAGTGLARVKIMTLNQSNEPVQTLIPNLLVPTRAASATGK